MTSTSAMTRRSTLIAAFALCSMLGACGSGKGSDTNTAQAAEATMVPSGSVTTPVGGSPANAPAFSRFETLQVTSKTVREQVAHPSSGLLVNGIVCRPNEVGRFPILMYQHAGFSGVGSDASGEGLCQYMADRGYAVFMLSFRGEDGSQGRVEYCGGEVEDTLQMLAIARNQSYVAADPELVEFIGQATANIGTPSTSAAGYRARSPLYSAEALANWGGALLVVHGARDEAVPPRQSCDLVRAVGGFRNSHISVRYVPGISERTVTSHPNECGAPDMQWTDSEHPGKQNWQGQRHFTFYDEMRHVGGIQLANAIDDAENFIRTRLPGGSRP